MLKTAIYSIFFASVLTTFACKSTSKSELEGTLETGGASNTRGVGATFPFEIRLLDHLKSNNLDPAKVLGNKKIFVSLDYFFPTNFTVYNNESVSLEETERLARAELDRLVKEYDYVIFANLFDIQNLPETWRTAMYQGDFLPLKTIYQHLSDTPKKLQKLKRINQLIDTYSQQHPGFRKMAFESFAQKLIQNNGFIRHGVNWNLKTDDLFADDHVHINDLGQAVAFNYIVRFALTGIPEMLYQVPPMDVPWNYSNSWREEIIRRNFNSPNQFKRWEAGGYWMKISDASGFSNERALLHKGNSASSASVTHLQGIADGISGFTYAGTAWGRSVASIVGGTQLTNTHYLGINQTKSLDTHRSITMDLSKLIFFTSIDLEEIKPGSGIYVGYGYDYWSSVAGTPVVNYRFVVNTATKQQGYVNVEWTIFPRLSDSDGRQEASLVRIPQRDPRWIRIMENPPASLPYLRYKYNIAVE